MKPYTLTNREGESISPMTSTKTVFDEHGTDLDTLLMLQRQDGENALKDYAKKTEVTQDLSGKQDKLSTTTDLHITDDNILGLTELAKMRLFIDLFNEAAHKGLSTECGRYDPENAPDPEHQFLLNELWLSYEEAFVSYSKWSNSNTLREKYWGAKIRTNFPQPLRDNVNAENAFYSSSIEVVNMTYTSTGWVRCSIQSGIFRQCQHLRRIITPLENPGQSSLDFENCRSLEEVRIKNSQPKDLYLSACSKLSFDSVDYIIRNGTSKGFTVHVHKDVYAKLTGDTTNAAASALTEEELTQWQQLLVDAAEKQITFATT